MFEAVMIFLGNISLEGKDILSPLVLKAVLYSPEKILVDHKIH